MFSSELQSVSYQGRLCKHTALHVASGEQRRLPFTTCASGFASSLLIALNLCGSERLLHCLIGIHSLVLAQAAYNNLERSLLDAQPAGSSARSTAGLLGAAPAPGPRGSPRGGAFVPVRPARRTLQDENAGMASTASRLLPNTPQLLTPPPSTPRPATLNIQAPPSTLTLTPHPAPFAPNLAPPHPSPLTL